ncbi:CGNR zinc finger domain-containing protein [Pseudonocardia xinjiangensis]|uniref:CGNR zinc finger domain-containing protein n=1 Tax=Pseudonocardia xinjiangensis TaxID=75289 RepID=A0ABX1RCM4_9PSEU|nr:CGNR zinc finger domain-containing protein [Pseudonocardia xinjiangensis]NMH78138.1 CGNR zinc finger domain-containing protein [Pseudonocardia xinjiangensis]
MTWSATDRYGMDAAPGGLAFVQDLLNTFSAGKPRKPDWLEDLGAAQVWLDAALSGWSRATGRRAPVVELDDRDRESLHDFRGSLRRMLARQGDGASPGPGSPAFPSMAASMRVDESGTITTEAAGTGWRRVASLALIECFEAQQTDALRRLKICRNERCACAFFDRSRNKTGVWHDVRVCGNATNLRAYRARQRAQTADRPAPVTE